MRRDWSSDFKATPVVPIRSLGITRKAQVAILLRSPRAPQDRTPQNSAVRKPSVTRSPAR